MSFHADLHCHSTFSDGLCSPVDLIELAQKKGLNALSITDHDTVDAYSEALVEAEKRGFPLLPGVEFSAQHKKESIHILGYAFALPNFDIENLCQKQTEIRRNRNEEMIANLKRLHGIEIKLPEKEWGSIGRAHMAQALVDQGVVSSVKEAFEKYVGDKRAAYLLGDKLTVQEVIAIIKKGSGKAILAHPHLIRKQRILREIFEMDLDGIEAYYASIALPNDKRVREIASAKRWLLTGGSDFHGMNKPYQDLGASYTEKETFTKLYDHYLTNKKAL